MCKHVFLAGAAVALFATSISTSYARPCSEVRRLYDGDSHRKLTQLAPTNIADIGRHRFRTASRSKKRSDEPYSGVRRHVGAVVAW